MKTVEWDMLVNALKSDLLDFVNGDMSSHNFYKIAVIVGVGPVARKLVRGGANRARKIGKQALQRRSIPV